MLTSAELAHWWETLNDPELNSLLTRAVAQNYDLKIALANLQQARAVEQVFVGTELPALDFTGTAGGGSGTSVARGGLVSGPLEVASTTTGLKEVTQIFGVDTSFELDLFGNLRREQEAINADTVAAAELRNQVLVTLVAQVTQAYVSVRTLQQRVLIAQQTIDAQSQSADVVRQRYQRGITNELDVALADRELQTTRAVLAPLKAQLLSAKRQVALLLGEDPDTLVAELADIHPLPLPPDEVDAGLPGDLLRRRPDVRQAEAQLVAANARYGVAIANLYPRVFLTAGGGEEGQGLGRAPVRWRGVWSVAPAVSFPLLDFGQADATVQVRDQQTRAQLANFRKIIINAIDDVENSLTGYDAERDRLASLDLGVRAAQRALDLANARYDRGIIDYLNVLDAERQLYDLEDQYAVSDETAVSDFVTVCESLGGGWQGFAPPPPLRAP